MTATPVTDLREKHQRSYRTYYEEHPEQTLKDQERQTRYQAESREVADRHGELWGSSDLEVALRLQQPIMVAAEDAQRTYAAIRQGRYRFLRQHGLRNSLLKNEADEYDALIRREDFTVDDLIEHDAKWGKAFGLTLPNGSKTPRATVEWGDWEVEMVKDMTISTKTLALKLGRTPAAVTKKRQRIKTLGARA